MLIIPSTHESTSWTRRKPAQLNRLVHAVRVTFASLVALRHGLRKAPLVYADIGARGGLSKSWELLWRLGLIEPVFVEPEPEAARQLRASYRNGRVISDALGERDGNATLYVTRQPGCSSLLRPSLSSHVPPQVTWMYEILKEVPVNISSTKNAFDRHSIAPDVLKMDVQGSELGILRGLGESISAITFIEIEVSFLPTYERQPLFQEIHDFLLEKDFALVDLNVFGVAGTGRAIQANARFSNRACQSERCNLIEQVSLLTSGSYYAS